MSEEQAAYEAQPPSVKPAHTPNFAEMNTTDPVIRQWRYTCENPNNPGEDWEFFLRERLDTGVFYEVIERAEAYAKFDGISSGEARSLANLELHLVNIETGLPLFGPTQLVKLRNIHGGILNELCIHAWGISAVRAAKFEELKND